MREQKPLTYRAYLGMTLPIMIAHVTYPLLAIVDFSVLGYFSSPIYMAGLAVGLTLLNTFYWVLGVLRVIAMNYSSQGIREEDEKGQAKALLEHIMLAFIIGSILIFAKELIWTAALWIQKPELEVMEQARLYYSVAIWGAPFVLMNYVIVGWLLGRNRIKKAVRIEVLGNTINMVLDIVFVKKFHMGIEGVAIAKLYAQLIMFSMGVILVFWKEKHMLQYMTNWTIWYPKNVIKKFVMNKDLLTRSICIVILNNTLIAISSRLGVTILATNAIILQMIGVIGYLFEGIANTVIVLAEKSKEEKNLRLLEDTHNNTLQCVMHMTIGLVVLYTLVRTKMINIFTNLEEVQNNFRLYDGWIVIYPILAGWGLSAYGLYIGLRQTEFIRYTNIMAVSIFIVCSFIMIPILGNHGLWLAFSVFYLWRSICLLGCEGSLHEGL